MLNKNQTDEWYRQKKQRKETKEEELEVRTRREKGLNVAFNRDRQYVVTAYHSRGRGSVYTGRLGVRWRPALPSPWTRNHHLRHGDTPPEWMPDAADSQLCACTLTPPTHTFFCPACVRATFTGTAQARPEESQVAGPSQSGASRAGGEAHTDGNAQPAGQCPGRRREHGHRQQVRPQPREPQPCWNQERRVVHGLVASRRAAAAART